MQGLHGDNHVSDSGFSAVLDDINPQSTGGKATMIVDAHADALKKPEPIVCPVDRPSLLRVTVPLVAASQTAAMPSNLPVISKFAAEMSNWSQVQAYHIALTFSDADTMAFMTLVPLLPSMFR